MICLMDFAFCLLVPSFATGPQFEASIKPDSAVTKITVATTVFNIRVFILSFPQGSLSAAVGIFH